MHNNLYRPAILYLLVGIFKVTRKIGKKSQSNSPVETFYCYCTLGVVFF